MQACWTVGYALGEIPSNLLLTRIRPRYWLPAMEVRIALVLSFLDIRLRFAFVQIIWTILTFSLSKCHTPEQIYILRFFIGISLLPSLMRHFTVSQAELTAISIL
jgi:hypothetical protein